MQPFPPRQRPGGKPKAYHKHCKDKYWSALRALGESLIANGTYSVDDALKALEAKEAMALACKGGKP